MIKEVWPKIWNPNAKDHTFRLHKDTSHTVKCILHVNGIDTRIFQLRKPIVTQLVPQNKAY